MALSISAGAIPDEAWTELSRLDLRVLSLCRAGDGALQEAARSKSLLAADINGDGYSETGLLALGRCPTVMNLAFDLHDGLQREVLVDLARCTNLKRIYFQGQMDDEVLSAAKDAWHDGQVWIRKFKPLSDGSYSALGAFVAPPFQPLDGEGSMAILDG